MATAMIEVKIDFFISLLVLMFVIIGVRFNCKLWAGKWKVLDEWDFCFVDKLFLRLKFYFMITGTMNHPIANLCNHSLLAKLF